MLSRYVTHHKVLCFRLRETRNNRKQYADVTANYLSQWLSSGPRHFELKYMSVHLTRAHKTLW